MTAVTLAIRFYSTSGPLFHRLSSYAFVFSLLWIGFAAAIGFLETPLRFQAGQVSRVEALAIGHLVFHGLNTVEIILAGCLILCSALAGNRPSAGPCRIGSQRLVLGVIVAILAGQTTLLFSVLDQRTLAIIQGEEVPEAAWHTLYIVLDVAKLGLLGVLTAMQIRRFRYECGHPRPAG